MVLIVLKKPQAFGIAAKQKLGQLIFNTTVYISKTGIDRYKRILAIVYDEQHACTNEEMLKYGFAWHFIRYDDNARWQQLEDKAREQNIGLWADNNPIPPWEWRKENTLK